MAENGAFFVTGLVPHPDSFALYPALSRAAWPMTLIMIIIIIIIIIMIIEIIIIIIIVIIII